jgi:2-oxoglutarate dehydrogenase complex dehydrogenase (E1) component-like enzyme
VLPDPAISREAADAVNKVILCSGKIYHELHTQRMKSGQDTTAIVRIEQLFPFPDDAVNKVIAKYPNAKKFLWVQEEPRNMGAYRFAQAQLKELCSIDVQYVGRMDSASPAVGSSKQHAIEQDKILTEAIGAAKSGGGPAGGPASGPEKKEADEGKTIEGKATESKATDGKGPDGKEIRAGK